MGLRYAGFGYDARGSRSSARTRDPSGQGRGTVEQGQQVDEEEDVDGHGEFEWLPTWYSRFRFMDRIVTGCNKSNILIRKNEDDSWITHSKNESE